MSARIRAAALIQRFQGCSFSAYRDGNGVLTIGYGHTAGVAEGDTCSQADADVWFLADLRDAEDEVTFSVPVPMSESMTAAMISLAYNIGGKQFRASEAVKALRAHRYLDVPKHMIAGDPSLRLLRRRLAEATLFIEDGLPE